MYKPLFAALLLGGTLAGATVVRADDYYATPNYSAQYNQNSYPSDQQPYYANQGQQYRQNPQAPLPRGAIEEMLRRQSFSDLRNFENKGNVYNVTALDQRGQSYRLMVDAYTGRIISAKPTKS